MTFETNFEYDDEGGYFRTLSCYPTFATDEQEADYYADDFLDTMNGFGAEPICVLCGVHTDVWTQGKITIEQARDRRFSGRVTEPCGSASQD